MKTQLYIVIAVCVLGAVTTGEGSASANDNREQKYIAVLESEASLFEKARACQQLAIVGTSRSVPVLAELLYDESLSDYARYAMEPIADSSVDDELRKAMGKVKGRLLAGVISSIGMRGDTKAVPGLQKLLYDSKAGVATEAIAALGRIASDDAIVTIRQALSAGDDRLRVAAAQAALYSAQRMVSVNKTQAAIELYDAVSGADVPGHHRRAAINGAIIARGKSSLPLVVKLLKSEESAMVRLALGAVRQLPGSDVTEKLIDEFSGFKPAVQALLIKAMLDRNDPNLRKGLQALAGSNDEQVRIEALKALGSIGNASSVAVLLRGAARGGDESVVALMSLRMLEGDGVDEAIISGMKSTKGKVRAELIGVIEDRRYQGASAALLVEAAGNDKAVAIASYKALRELAGDGEMAALVGLLVKADDKQIRDIAERAVASAAGRIEDPHRRADDVLSMLTATSDIETRCSLLRVLGRIGNDEAFEALRAAVADKNAKVRDVAVRQLADWKDSRAINILSLIAGETSNETHRVLALRGYVRLVGADTDMSQKTKVDIYRNAIDSAKSDNEKKLILAGIANVKHPEALDVIVDFIDIESVRDEAVLGTLKIAQASAGADPDKARAAALKVRQVATDEKLRAQADNLIKAIDGFDDFIVAWQMAGPYRQENRDYSALFDIEFAPEKGDDNVQWSLMPAGTDSEKPWILDLLKHYGGKSCVAYVKTWIKSDKRRQAILETGSDDGIKAWLNGKLVHANNAARAAIPGSDKTKITLNEGWNKLLLKITQNVLGWEFTARIRTAEGGRIDALKIDCLGEQTNPVVGRNAVSIFNGKTFSGWEGNLDFFRIQDGAIVGGTLKNEIPRNEFLCATKEYDNFELRLNVKLLGNPANANAGIQIRSRRIPNHNEMIGYQADMGQHYWGCLYDESRRRKVLANADRAQLDKILRPAQWNEYVIRCEGKRIRLWINGRQTIDYTEPDDSIEQTGLIGLQIHSGPPSEAWYKDITIKQL